MRIRLYRGSKGGWYLYGVNYKDKEDKAYCNVFFPQNSEPCTMGDYVDMDILEAKGNSFNKKFGLTVFKYNLISDVRLGEQEQKQDEAYKCGKAESNDIDISPDELPFY